MGDAIQDVLDHRLVLGMHRFRAFMRRDCSSEILGQEIESPSRKGAKASSVGSTLFPHMSLAGVEKDGVCDSRFECQRGQGKKNVTFRA